MSENEHRKRGRPRQYDPEQALAKATASFWQHGFSGTSLDDLVAATGMNRPSLYAAFGDKQSLYLKTLQSFRRTIRESIMAAMADAPSLQVFLTRFYAAALDLYLSEPSGRGCYFICTAATEAMSHPEVRELLAGAITELDRFFEQLVRNAQATGEIGADVDPAMLAQCATATLHTLALRARAGFDRTALEALVTGSVALICRNGRCG